MSRPNNHMVLSALGKDRPGIVDEFSRVVYDLGCNITDSRMTTLGGEFAILIMVEGPWNQLAKLEGQIPEMEKRLGLTIISKQTDIRQAKSDMLPYLVEVVALDHPGIVHKLANFFARRSINIGNLNTSSYPAPHTGSPMFAVEMSLEIPARIQLAQLRDEFLDFCDALNLDAVLEPYKR